MNFRNQQVGYQEIPFSEVNSWSRGLRRIVTGVECTSIKYKKLTDCTV